MSKVDFAKDTAASDVYLLLYAGGMQDEEIDHDPLTGQADGIITTGEVFHAAFAVIEKNPKSNIAIQLAQSEAYEQLLATVLPSATAGEVVDWRQPNDYKKKSQREWKKVSPFASEVYRHYKEQFAQSGSGKAGHGYWDFASEKVTTALVDAATLRTHSSSSTSSENIPISRLILEQDGCVEKISIDPLDLVSADPYDYIIASSRDEAASLIEQSQAFNKALLDICNAEDPLLGSGYEVVQDLWLEMELGTTPIQSEDSMALLAVINDVEMRLNERWSALYETAGLLPIPHSPLHVDGDLPLEYRWQRPQTFKSFEQEELYRQLIDFGPPPQALADLRLLQSFIKDDGNRFLEGLKTKYGADFAGQMSGVYYTAPVSVSEGDFRYPDLIFPPARELVLAQAESLASDRAIAVDQVRTRLNSVLWINNPVWKMLTDEFNTVTQKIWDGDESLLAPPIAGGSLQGDRLPADAIAKWSENIFSAVVTMYQKQLKISEFSNFVFSDYISVIESEADKDAKQYYQIQLAIILRAIPNIIGKTSWPSSLSSSNDASLDPLLSDSLQLIENIIAYLEGRNVEDSLFIENSITEIDKINEVLEKAQGTLSIPRDLVNALELWPRFQGLKEKLLQIDADGVWTSNLTEFISGSSSARDFFANTQDLPAIEGATGADFLSAVDLLEKEVCDYVWPEQAEKFVNRLRYALYLNHYKVKEKNTAEQVHLDTFEGRVAADLWHWFDALDTGWPGIDGTSSFIQDDALLDEYAFKPDITFEPRHEAYISQDEFLNYFNRDCSEPEQIVIARLTRFFADYENGYYRYFSPIAFERDVNGRESKGVRDHTCYNQLLIVLQDIADYAEDLSQSPTDLDPSAQEYCQRVARIARAVTYNINQFLKQQPQSPYWVLTQDGHITGIVPQESISHPTSISLGTILNESTLSSQNTLYHTQNQPWDFFYDSGAFAKLTNDFAVAEWVGTVTEEEAKFYYHDFDHLSNEEWKELKEVFIGSYTGISFAFQKSLSNLAAIVDELIYDGTYNNRKKFVLDQKTKMAEVLSSIISEEDFYAVNKEYFDKRIQKLPVSERHLINDLILEGDTAELNINLLKLVCPLLVPQACMTYRHIADTSMVDEISQFEDHLSVLDPPEKKHPFIEVYLASANEQEVGYLIGRLCEAADVTQSDIQIGARYQEIKEKILHISYAELVIIPGLIWNEHFRDGGYLSSQGVSEYTSNFLLELTPAERLWVAPYLQQKVAASDRSRSNSSDDVHFENVRQTDVDLFAINLDPVEAGRLREEILQRYGMCEESFPVNDELAMQWIKDINEHFKKPEIRKTRESYLQALALIEKAEPSDYLPVTEALYFRIKGEKYSAVKSSVADKVLAVVDAAQLSSWQLQSLYHFSFGMAQQRYKWLAYTFMRGEMQMTPGLMEPGNGKVQEGDSESQDHFWNWLWNAVWIGKSYKDNEELVTDIDDALSRDFGHDLSSSALMMDLPTELLIRHTLDQMSAEPLAREIRTALFEPFDLADPVERKTHSLYNRSGYFYPTPMMDLARIYSPENLVRISIEDHQPELRNAVYTESHDIMNALVAIRILLEKPDQDDESELLAQHSFQNLEILSLLMQAGTWQALYDQTIKLLTHPEHPYPSLRVERAQNNYPWIEQRMKLRLQELNAEKMIRELVAIGSVSNDYKEPNPLSILWRERSEMKPDELKKYDEIIYKLNQSYPLFEPVPTECDSTALTEYRMSIRQNIADAIMVASGFTTDLIMPDSDAANYDELSLALSTDLKGLAQYSGSLADFSRYLYQDIFAQIGSDELVGPVINISADVGGHDSVSDTAKKLNNTYWMPIQDIYRAQIVLQRMLARLKSFSASHQVLSDNQNAQLRSLEELLHRRFRYLGMELKKMQQTQEMLQPTIFGDK